MQLALMKALGKLFLRSAMVSEVTQVAQSFRRITLEGTDLRGIAFRPGDKLQLFIPDQGMRTYTPLGWESSIGRTEILVFIHGDGPGARWGASVPAKATCRFFGPRRSLDVPGDEPLVIFGDETSFAVAAAYQSAGRQVLPVLEVRSASESRTVAEMLGLTKAILVERTQDDAHLVSVYGQLTTHLSRDETALALTGRAQAIQALRRMDRDRGQKAKATKAYWSLGKRGLD